MKKTIILAAAMLTLSPLVLAEVDLSDPVGDEQVYVHLVPASGAPCYDPTTDITGLGVTSDGGVARGRLAIVAFDERSMSAVCAGVEYPRAIRGYQVRFTPLAGQPVLFAGAQVDPFGGIRGGVGLHFADTGDNVVVGPVSFDAGGMSWSAPLSGTVVTSAGPRAYDLRGATGALDAMTLSDLAYGGIRMLDFASASDATLD